MVLKISDRKLTVIENGIYYFELINYPSIAEDELKTLYEFFKYEKSHGRQTEVVCEDERILTIVNDVKDNLDTMKYAFKENIEHGFVYHATDLTASQKILSVGKLLSAAKVYEKTGEELSFEKRDTSWNDPADYFEYIMFCWGDNPTGDYVVLSENFPSEEDLKNGDFNLGVRFYFRYEDIICHPGHIFDGYHAVKVKDEIKLCDYLHSCIVPDRYKNKLENFVSSELTERVHYLSQNGLGISDWNEKVYDFVCKL